MHMTIRLIIELEENSKVLIDWINNNYVKANPDKFHILLSQSQNELNDNITTINIDNNIILNEGSENLLGLTIDNKLTFKDHVSNLCKTASQTLHALARVSQYMDLLQRKLIINSFIVSQFGYFPLVWIFHSRKLNNRINNIQERSLRIIYEDYTSTFEELLEKDKFVTIHIRNVQILAIELYKVVNNIVPEILKGLFPLIMSRKTHLKQEMSRLKRMVFKAWDIWVHKYGI